MITTKTPFRASLAGGGTDLADYYKTGYGAVVSAAINKSMYITVNKRFEDNIRVSYSETEIVDEVSELRHELVRECLKMTGIRKGIEITSIADVPAGTGLGSSSCFTVGLLNALFTYTGRSLSSEELAECACDIEIGILKHPIGKQDQYACACGGLNYFRFNQDGTVERQTIPLDEWNIRKMGRKLLMFYTGMNRSADQILKEQKQRTGSKLEILDAMRDQAAAIRDILLEQGFVREIGVILHEGWMKKKCLADRIDNPAINEAYERALAAGAVGGKLLGAGGGGFLLFYCDENKQEAVQRAVGLREVEFRLSPYGSRVVYSG